MVDKTKIDGTVNIADNSAERVAFDLLKDIINASPERQDEVLELYARCLAVTKNPTSGVKYIKDAVK